MQYTPRDLAEGEELRFGASTRRYTLQRRPGSGGSERSRKRSVSWPDEADDAGVCFLIKEFVPGVGFVPFLLIPHAMAMPSCMLTRQPLANLQHCSSVPDTGPAEKRQSTGNGLEQVTSVCTQPSLVYQLSTECCKWLFKKRMQESLLRLLHAQIKAAAKVS